MFERFPVILAALSLSLFAQVTNARAQVWHTLASDARFSIDQSDEGTPSAWLRMIGHHDAARDAPAYEEQWIGLRFRCEGRQYAVTSQRLLDGAGHIIREVHAPSATALEWRLVDDHDIGGLGYLLVAACSHGLLDEPPAAFRDPGITGEQLIETLRSGDEAARSTALSKFLAAPSAFPPLLFSNVAEELVRRGRVAEAARWYEFGFVRYLVDLQANYGSIPTDMVFVYRNTSENLAHALASIPATENRRLLEEAFSLDRSTSRYYPIDAMNAPPFGWNVAWGRENLAGSDLLQRQRLETSRSVVRALLVEQAQ